MDNSAIIALLNREECHEPAVRRPERGCRVFRSRQSSLCKGIEGMKPETPPAGTDFVWRRPFSVRETRTGPHENHLLTVRRYGRDIDTIQGHFIGQGNLKTHHAGLTGHRND